MTTPHTHHSGLAHWLLNVQPDARLPGYSAAQVARGLGETLASAYQSAHQCHMRLAAMDWLPAEVRSAHEGAAAIASKCAELALTLDAADCLLPLFAPDPEAMDHAWPDALEHDLVEPRQEQPR